MKKLLLAAVAAVMTTGAFAQSHMVMLENIDGGKIGSLNLSQSSDDADAKTETMNLALNYTYAINGSWMVGLAYEQNKSSNDGNDDATTMTKTGLHAFYNINGTVNDTCYVGLRYVMTNYSNDGATDSDSNTDIVLEYGHRFALGKLGGMDWAYAPAASYTMGTYSDDSADEDTATTTLAVQPVRFNVMF